MGKKLMTLGLTSTLIGTATGAAWFAFMPNLHSTGDMLALMSSYNWAGYVDQAVSSPYTTISGSWTVPSISGVNQSADAEWVGLGGVQSQDLLQMGTIQTMNNGQQQDVLFWEQLPQAATQIASVAPGDLVHVTIAKSNGSNWELTATIQHGSQTMTKHVTVALSTAYTHNIEQTAEWIREDPEDTQQQIITMANAGTVAFSQATVNGQPIEQANAKTTQSILMPQGQGAEIVPSSIGQNSTSFTTSPTTTTNIQNYPSTGNSGSFGSFSSGTTGSWPGSHHRWGRDGSRSQNGWPTAPSHWQIAIPETSVSVPKSAFSQMWQALQLQFSKETAQLQQLFSQTTSTQSLPWTIQMQSN